MKTLAFNAFRKLVRLLSPLEARLARLPLIPRLYHAAYKRIKPRGLIQVTVEGAQLWVDADDEGIARPLLLKGEFEPDETMVVKRLLEPGMRVADIGANIGYYSVLASRLVGDGGRVFAFEPSPHNFELLSKNVEANNCRNVRAFPLALANRAGTATLFLDGSATGNPSIAGANVPDRAGSVVVSTARLDDVLMDEARIDFVKIDVQGAEGLVLAGASRVLSQRPLKMLLELWPSGLRNLGTDPTELLERLRGYGFTIDVIEPGGQRHTQSNSEILARAEGRFSNLLLWK